ncbi:hypothetical protein [Actinomadura bangladeshensis]|uniref:Uncharacterized protein n=1 Tax=Actinomadura bangladeshensis TaxID=453573 RepID=A0A6L9QBM8_9ACTN|nr:hypothetical protein [Actinomadura bangladeshensis]NEA22811.1 hypothetical protein [Actinomadura bangladeshensis]
MPAHPFWEEILILGNYEWQSRLAKSHRAEGFGEGFAEGMATALAIVLETRGIAVSDELGERVMTCTDAERLEGWLRRAVVTGEVEEIFG